MRAAQEVGKGCYYFLAFDGDMLSVEIFCKDGETTDTMLVPYIFRGDEKTPLDFSYRKSLAMLNGEVVCVDLTKPAGVKWLTDQPKDKLKTIRTVLLSGKASVDVPALRRLAGMGITVGIGDLVGLKSHTPHHVVRLDTEVAKALVAAKPAGLVAGNAEIPDTIIAQLPDLTHLAMAGLEIPDLTKHKKLRFLSFCFIGDRPSSLALLAKLRQLHGLRIIRCRQVKDFTPLEKLTRLRDLAIVGDDSLANLDFLAGMQDLRSLFIMPPFEVEKTKLKSIAPIAKLTNLSELFIFPMPKTVKDLRPIMKLKKLKLLTVDKDSLEKRKAEYDEIRKALPECKIEIIGFCMGSAWILVVLPAAVAAGLFWRRRRRAAAGKVA
jgi:Leucine-rich repeat (LRR) protein